MNKMSVNIMAHVRLKLQILIFAFICLTIGILFYFKSQHNEIQCNKKNDTKSKLEQRYAFAQQYKTLTRDFFYYECRDRRRIGGLKKPHEPLARIDGAWYVCFDRNLAPVTNKCIVLSFGINEDESFDYEVNKHYGCRVHSFDPYVESSRFREIRNSDPNLAMSYKIKVNTKWTFYRVGLTGSPKNVLNKNKIGWIATLEDILDLTNLKNKIVDIFKMDIEWWERSQIVGGEKDVLENLNIDYACKYFKQFMLETHSSNAKGNLLMRLLRKLEKCFSIFYRDTRFIIPGLKGEVFKSAAQEGFRLDLGIFGDEVVLSNFLISTGELYFVNEYFI